MVLVRQHGSSGETVSEFGSSETVSEFGSGAVASEFGSHSVTASQHQFSSGSLRAKTTTQIRYGFAWLCSQTLLLNITRSQNDTPQ